MPETIKPVFAAVGGEGFSALAAELRATPCLIMLLKGISTPSPGLFLSSEEISAFGSFKIQKRRDEWLGGRLAAKMAGRLAFYKGAPLRDIEVHRESTGVPFLVCRGERKPVSISHSGGVCGAAAGPDFLGLDIEQTAPRHPAWTKDYFSPAEREGKSDLEMTGLWAAKEAMLKALGLGLSCDTLETDFSGPEPVLRGKALARWTELGRPHFSVAAFEPGEGMAGRAVFGA